MNNIYAGYFIEIKPIKKTRKQKIRYCPKGHLTDDYDTYCSECGSEVIRETKIVEYDYTYNHFLNEHERNKTVFENEFYEVIINNKTILIPNDFGLTIDSHNKEKCYDIDKQKMDLNFFSLVDFFEILEKTFNIEIKFGVVTYNVH